MRCLKTDVTKIATPLTSERPRPQPALPYAAFLTVEHLRLKASKKLPIILSGTGLAAHLRYRRETLGLTRAEAAKRLGIRGAAVGQWETGDHHPEAEYWPALRFHRV